MNPEDMLCRVKNPQDNATWLYGYYFAAKTTSGNVKQFLKVVDKNYNAIGGAVISDDTTLCRTTTLKDKNGTLIFEGDIVNVGLKHKVLRVVQYREAHFESVCSYDKIPLTESGAKCYEVIGNRWDNPELLEKII